MLRIFCLQVQFPDEIEPDKSLREKYIIQSILSILSNILPVFAFHFDSCRAEVDEKADVLPERRQVVYQLNLVGLAEVFNRLEFYDNFVFDQQVHVEITYHLVVIIDLQWLLFFDLQGTFGQFDDHPLFVNTFKKTKAQGIVDLVGAGDDLMR